MERIPLRSGGRIAALALAAILTVAAAQPAMALRVVTYNLKDFPSDSWATRVDDFQKIMDEIDADVVIVQEMESSSGVTLFLNNSLNVTTPGEYSSAPFVNGPDTDNALYYKPSTVQYINQFTVYTSTRYTMEYIVKPVGYSSADAELWVLSTHLKAGTDPSDEAERLNQTEVIRAHLNALPSGTSFILGGDFNVRSSNEACYRELTEDQADNDGRCKDPVNKPGYWHDAYTFRMLHSQCPRDTYGGLDDRFDQLLISYSMDDDEGLDYILNSHVVFGQDGFHLNQSVNYGVNYAVGETLADALYDASDHMPVYFDVQVPAKVDAAASLGFGSVIVGATAEENLNVGNAATAPADELTYTLAAPAGFGAPGGTFEAEAGSSNDHTISMDTGTGGVKSGYLIISSDDVDEPDWYIALSGTVLDHAVPSLDSGGIALVDTLDFGMYVCPFPNQTLSIYNDGYGSLQALLDVYDATIVGGDGRFSFVDPFVTKQASASPAEYQMEFDCAGAAGGALYEGTLTLKTRDEAGIPGAAERDSLTVHLKAYVIGTGVPDEGVRALSLSPGVPNPFTDTATLRLALPERVNVSLRVYDVAGRYVATLASGEMPAGVFEIRWNGRDHTGAEVASGAYFCRAEIGDWIESRKLMLLR